MFIAEDLQGHRMAFWFCLKVKSSGVNAAREVIDAHHPIINSFEAFRLTPV